MKRRFASPHFYNHVFYSSHSAAWKMTAFFIMGMALSISLIFLWNYVNPSEAVSSHVRTIAVLLALALMIPVLFFQLRNLKKLQIGVGSGGVYIRGYGLLTWSEIKKMELMAHEQRGKVIKITTYHPEEYADGTELSPEKNTGSTFSRLGESLNELFIVGGEFISIPLEELFSLLQEYHQAYQQEDQKELPAHPVAGSAAVTNGLTKSFISTFFFKIGLLIALALALTLALFLKGGVTGLWIELAAGSLFTVALVFNVYVFFVEILAFIIAVASIGAGAIFSVYFLVVDKKINWGPVLMLIIGIIMLIAGVRRVRLRKRDIAAYNRQYPLR